jgi:RimJ/RimL family protein N-acetyltransferase
MRSLAYKMTGSLKGAEVPVLETERLILRRPGTEDLADWIENFSDSVTMHFIGGAQPPNMAWRNLTSVVGAWTVNGFSMFSVIEKATGRWVGRLGPWRPEGWPGNEVGWALARHAEGKGYATEGVSAARDFAFEVLGWERMIHSIDPLNTASIAVAHRIGSRHIGTLRLPAPGERDIDGYGQTRAEWLAAREAQ